MSAFSATCHRIESPDVRTKDRRALTAYDVVREDLSETSPYQRNFTHNVCDESFTDRDTYLAHMRECHGLSLGPMARVSTRKPRAPKAPAQKTYDPAPLDPGAWVRWTDGGQERTGQVWSAGPYAHSVWVVPTDPEEGKPAVELRRSSLKSLGHAVPVGLFGDDDASDDAPTGARIEPGPGRVFTDAAAVREHWVAGGDGPANENVRESDRERLRVLALTPARDLVLSGGLVAVKRTSAPAGWDILHAGTGRGLGRGPLRTKRDAVQALTLLAMLPVAWQDTADIAAGAVNHAPRVNGESVLTAQMGLIFAGQATEDSIREAVGKMAPTVEDESPTVEDESAPDYGVTVDGTMVATVRRVSIDTPSEPATVEASDPGPVESGPDDAATDAHSATLEPDATYPHLVRWHCACGVSGVGWTRPSIAGSMHADTWRPLRPMLPPLWRP